MKRILVLAAISALVLPAAALAKGPSAATVNGPGIGGLRISGDGESGGTTLGNLTEEAGFFPAVWGQEPNPLLNEAPKGNLGPKYTITYTVPGPTEPASVLKQDLYPYAKPYPVTYMKTGQTFWGREKTHGGWFLSSAALKDTLVGAGLPKVAPSVSSSGDGFFSARTFSMLAAALALLLGASAVIFMRRRARPATAT